MPLGSTKKLKTLDELLTLKVKDKDDMKFLKAIVKSVEDDTNVRHREILVAPHFLMIPLSMIVKCCELDVDFARICEDPGLVKCWNRRLEDISAKAKPIITMDGKTISALDQLKGHYFLHYYERYRRQNKSDSREAQALLNKALSYKAFNAYQLKLDFIQNYFLSSTSLMSREQVDKIVRVAWDAGAKHWTWGYLEAAYIFLHLGTYLREVADNMQDANLYCEGGDYYRDALTCLFLAESLEPIEYSQHVIQGAGNLGKCLLRAKEQMLGSWNKGRIKILATYEISSVDDKDVTTLELAKNKAKLILNSFPLAKAAIVEISSQKSLEFSL